MRYLNKYRIESHRWPGWDYSADGLYFITLVTQHRICNLGEIDSNNQMILSDFGKIVETEWLRSFEIRQELICDEYIIMPNHLHAIIIIDQSGSGNQSKLDTGIGSSGIGSVQTHGRASLRPSPSPSQSQSPSQSPSQYQPIRLPKSISSFLAGFKSAVNSKIDDFIDLHNLKTPKYNRNNHFFQPNYHDHIIRNEGEYARIKNYIIQNPKKWNDDKFKT
jgi:putative transposase